MSNDHGGPLPDDTSNTAAAKVRRPTEPELSLIRRMAGAGVMSRTDVPRLLAEVDSLRAERDTLRSCYGNLMARIFRDGGQHYHDIGDDRAALAEADEVVASMLGAADDLKRTEAGAAVAREALTPFAAVARGIPRNWPGGCSVYWKTFGLPDGIASPKWHITYHHLGAEAGPSVDDYRQAGAALASDAGAKLLMRLATAEELCDYAQGHVDGMKPDNVSPRLAELLAAWRAAKEGGGGGR